MESIPSVAYESSLARQERTIKRLFIIIILLIFFLVGTNIGWLVYESQFEDVSTEISQDIDTGNGDAVVAGIGDVSIGESETESNS